MKKFIAIVSFLCLGLVAQAQSPNGSFVYGSSVPFYTKLDTVTNTGTDTFKFKQVGYVRSVGFQFNVTKISGTLGGTIKVYGSKDGGLTYGTTALASYTVTDGNQAANVDINSGQGNPFTNYISVWSGAATMSGSWIGYVLVR